MPNLMTAISKDPDNKDTWCPAVMLLSAYLERNHPLERYLIWDAGSHTHKARIKEAE
jgi:hypothetical protein